MPEKRLYWLKLKEGFFTDKIMKKLRRMAGGDTYTIIYLKLLLLGLRNGGKLYFDHVEDSFAEELALEIDEDSENVRFCILYLEKNGLVEEVAENELFLTFAGQCPRGKCTRHRCDVIKLDKRFKN